MTRRFALILPLLLLSACCTKVGPGNLQQDSVCYNEAFSNSKSEQILLNIVRLRYRDNPSFLQIGLISTSYDFNRKLKVPAVLNSSRARFFGTVTPEVDLSYNEKPTITYNPLRGDEFVTEMLSPIAPHTLMLLNSSGWAIDRIFKCCVQRMNSLLNAPSASGPTPLLAPAYEDFHNIAEILREFQMQHALYVVARPNTSTGNVDIIMKVYRDIVDEEKLKLAWNLLGVEEDTSEVRLLPYMGGKREPNDVMLDTRSPMGVLYFLSQSVEVPCSDIDKGLVTVTTNRDCDGDNVLDNFDWGQLLDGIMKIKVVEECEPYSHASVAVGYRGHTFFIEDNDLGSKSTFSLLTQLLALQFSGESIMPAFTIPLGGT